MYSTSLQHHIAALIALVKRYGFPDIIAKPAPASWSLGQLCMHLLSETGYYLGQVKQCVASDENSNMQASADALVMFQNNALPDQVIDGPSSNNNTPQPLTKQQLLDDLRALMEAVDVAAGLVSANVHKGKSAHPGLLYFNAAEWLQFADMHFRHHLLQQAKIVKFLEERRC